MSNANHNPQQPQGEPLGNGQPAGQYGQPGQGQYSHASYNANTTYNTNYENGRPKPNAKNGGEISESSFFRWIRESGVQRTNNRVIAGVCGAIAQELGWNVTLVRVLMVVLAFMGGAGVFFYGLAWALLPDESDGSILLEDLIHGHWNWSFIGVILCILLSGVLVVPFFGFHGAVNVMPILLSALAMYLVIDHGRRRFMQPNSMNGGIGGNGGSTGGYGGPAPVPPMPPMPNAGERPAGPFMPAQQPGAYPNAARYGMPAAAPQNIGYTQYAQPAQPFRGERPNVTQPESQSSAQQSADAGTPTVNMPPVAADSASAQAFRPAQPQSASQSAYHYTYHYEPKDYTYEYRGATKARRKPAGSAVVLLFLGLLIAGMAVVSLICGSAGNGSFSTLFGASRGAVLFIGGACLVLGLIIVALGCAGRRTGGLHPFAWTLMFLAVIAMCFGGTVATANSLSPYLAKDYTHVNVGKTLVIDSSKASTETLRKGIAVQGEGYAKSTLTIDLTKYAEHNKAKQVRLNDGQTRTTYCPVETIPMTVTDAKVTVKIPYGCSWGFNVSSGMMSTWNSIDAQGGLLATGVGSDRSGAGYDWLGDDDHGNGWDIQAGRSGFQISGAPPDGNGISSWYSMTGDMNELCENVGFGDDMNHAVTKNTDPRVKQLAENGYYWPCLTDNAKSVAHTELNISPRLLRNASVTVSYGGDIADSAKKH